MRLTGTVALIFAAVILAGYSSSAKQLSRGGQNVRFVDQQPGSECQYLGVATGEQNNCFSGQQTEVGSFLRGAANDLRHKAAETGGNVISNASTPAMSFVSNFVPVLTKMSGQI